MIRISNTCFVWTLYTLDPFYAAMEMLVDVILKGYDFISVKGDPNCRFKTFSFERTVDNLEVLSCIDENDFAQAQYFARLDLRALTLYLRDFNKCLDNTFFLKKGIDEVVIEDTAHWDKINSDFDKIVCAFECWHPDFIGYRLTAGDLTPFLQVINRNSVGGWKACVSDLNWRGQESGNDYFDCSDADGIITEVFKRYLRRQQSRVIYNTLSHLLHGTDTEISGCEVNLVVNPDTLIRSLAYTEKMKPELSIVAIE